MLSAYIITGSHLNNTLLLAAHNAGTETVADIPQTYHKIYGCLAYATRAAKAHNKHPEAFRVGGLTVAHKMKILNRNVQVI